MRLHAMRDDNRCIRPSFLMSLGIKRILPQILETGDDFRACSRYIKLCFCFYRKLIQIIKRTLLPVKQCRNAIRGSNGEKTGHTVVPFGLIYFIRQSAASSTHLPHSWQFSRGHHKWDITHWVCSSGGLQLTF